MAEKPLKSLKFHGLDDIYKIPSTAEDVGAATPQDVNAAKEEAKTYTDTQVRTAAPRNLLVNSDFTNPVNQRGQTIYETGTNYTYTIDRWCGRYGTVLVNSGYLNWKTTKDAQYKRIRQPTECTLKSGHTYTLAILARVNDTSKTWLRFATNSGGGIVEKTLNNTGDFEWITLICRPTSDYEKFMVEILSNNNDAGYIDIDIKTVVVYDGAYTAETLPEYQPKGYSTELTACQRYLQRFRTQNLRGTYCEDFRPTMRMTNNGVVSTFTQDADGVTYYFASAEL